MRKGVEDGDETVDGVEREGGDGGYVAGGEEGGLDEEEEEDCWSEVRERERAVGVVFLGWEARGRCWGFGGSGSGWRMRACSCFRDGSGERYRR